MLGRNDLGWHPATPLGPTRLERQWLSDEGKSSPFGPGFLDRSAGERQPLPRPGL